MDELALQQYLDAITARVAEIDGRTREAQATAERRAQEVNGLLRQMMSGVIPETQPTQEDEPPVTPGGG